MCKTHAAVFPALDPFPVAFQPYEDVETLRTIMLVATAERDVSRGAVLARAKQVAGRVRFPRFVNYAADYYSEPVAVDDVPVLTDDYAPVDTLVSIYHWTPPKRP
ncbi:MAG TPA: hypothetical protein VI007_05640 [bacterium]